MYWLGVLTVAAPAFVTLVLGVVLLVGVRPSEVFTHRLLQCGVTAGLLAAAGVFVLMLAGGDRDVSVNLGDWVYLPGSEPYHFELKFEFDRLSVPFAVLTLVLVGTVGAFARKYMHRESGYHRFFMLFALFATGMTAAAVSGTVETLFTGWELVGLSSVLLVGFFHERPAPVRNGFWVWVVYRGSDAALMLAAILTHRVVHEGDFHKLLGTGVWPYEVTGVSAWDATLIGGLLLFAAAGKSALLPFCGWLPRAMEGPTPSSAVFYGALSVHLGAFLLLRISPLFEKSATLAGAALALGLGTAAFAAVVGRVQSDIKSVLSFASLTQVGVIVAEIGLIGLTAGRVPDGWGAALWYVPIVHLIGHACLRTLQFVRAPSLLLDYKAVENAIGVMPPRTMSALPAGFRLRLYQFSLDRGHLDAILSECVARPFVVVFRFFDRLEGKWADWLNGRPNGATAPPADEGQAGRRVASPPPSPSPGELTEAPR